MTPQAFFELLQQHGIGFFCGVPDSLLKAFCAYISDHVPAENHLICANEGAAVGMAAGYHLATQGIALVYMQNSGLGNAVNPLLSIAAGDVYRIPLLMLIGWRGEPGHADEPQHKQQGRLMPAMLDAMEIPYQVLGGDLAQAVTALEKTRLHFREHNTPFALVARKDTFSAYSLRQTPQADYELTREDAIKFFVDLLTDQDITVSTTGMASRELYEYRDALGQGHERDFLTVGGMGHASQIALGIALQKPGRRVFCLDGDGAALMHMGSLAISGIHGGNNFVHMVINNGVHASVGGQPTVGLKISLMDIAKGCGYKTVLCAQTRVEFTNCFKALESADGPIFIEVQVRQGQRSDLGRPHTTPEQNKQAFIQFLERGQ